MGLGPPIGGWNGPPVKRSTAGRHQPPERSQQWWGLWQVSSWFLDRNIHLKAYGSDEVCDSYDWTLTFCQPHAVTSRWIKILIPQFKAQVTKPQVRSWITVLDTSQSTVNATKSKTLKNVINSICAGRHETAVEEMSGDLFKKKYFSNTPLQYDPEHTLLNYSTTSVHTLKLVRFQTDKTHHSAGNTPIQATELHEPFCFVIKQHPAKFLSFWVG